MPDPLDNVEDAYGLTPVQEGMLFHSLASPDSAVYVEQFSCVISGGLDLGRFRAAWDRVYASHPALRTIFLWENLDAPLQVVRSTVALPWVVADWRDATTAEQDLRLHGYLGTDRGAGIDLTAAPLARIFLARLDDSRWRFLWTFYHANLDGWSLSLVLTEVLEQYELDQVRDAPSPSIPRPFGDYVKWLAAQDANAASGHWRDLLRGFDEPSTPLVHCAPPSRDVLGRAEHRIAAPLWGELKALARRHRLTPSTLVHGSWALLLHLYSGRNDLVFGSTLSGRSVALEGVESMIGCFLNTLPLRVAVDPAMPLLDWLERLQQAHLEMRRYEYSSLTSARKNSDLPPGRQLLETIVVFQNLEEIPTASPSGAIELSETRLLEKSNFSLALLAIPEDSNLRFILNFDPARYPAETAREMLEILEGLLREFTTTPASDPLKILLDRAFADDPGQVKWSHGPALSHPPVGALELFTRHAAKHPDQPALHFRDTTLTYAELTERAAALAARLRAAGAASGDCIGLCVERSTEMVIGILGILHAGCAYLPLDPAYPPARLASMLEDSAAGLLLSRGGLHEGLPASHRLNIDEHSEAGHQFPPIEFDGDRLAYVIYTSGSTGKPKGIGVTHGNLAASLAARHDYYGAPVERFLLLSSFSFDSSIVGIFGTLCGGGTLILPGEKEEQDLDLVADLIATHSVSHTLCLPSLYALLLEHAPAEKLRSLRVTIVAGEECPPGVCRRHHSTLPQCELHNEYGPSEATVWCAAWQSVPGEIPSRVPIGRPIPGVEIQLLHPDRRPVLTGVAGELYVGGPGVTPGYLKRPKLTAERFVRDPKHPTRRLYRTGDLACWLPDGNLLFLGRIDQQIKLRGHRIELGEIESVLAAHPSVAEVAAIATAPPVGEDVESLLAALEKLDPADADALLTEASH